MSAPNPASDGFRYYGRWAGSAMGPREDRKRCIEEVVRGNQPYGRQCERRRGHGPDGLYCKQHDPAAIEARRQVATERWQRRTDRRSLPFRKAVEFEEVLRSIAEGHIDPQRVAREALAKFKDEAPRIRAKTTNP